MKAIHLIIAEFQDLGTRVAFDLKTGEHFEGYIFEIETESLMFVRGGPLASDEEIQICLSDIDLTTLAYFDERGQCYMDAHWHEDRDCWRIKPTRQAEGWMVYHQS
jgi:uncharacterized protein YggL (DUF469 family)